ncbi:hypothetical protein AB0K14_25645 [Actinosynnema sp. NPDC050801]|uniref:hypothetical protein n=1 Tax=unclassified Actinosynnema TaxID=2637065 RepID=UPI0033E5C240
METSSTILALDFTGVGAAQSFGSLPIARTARRVDPLGAHFDRRRAITEQAAELCEQLGEAPRHVFGYCSGAVLAATVAACFRERTGTEPQVVLFDPDPVGPDYVRDEFALLFASLGGVPPVTTGADLTWYEQRLADLRPDLVRDAGGDEAAGELVDYLLARHRAWLRFLDACAEAPPASLEGVVSVITGRKAVTLAGVLTRPERHVAFQGDAPEGALLAHPSTESLVRAALMR